MIVPSQRLLWWTGLVLVPCMTLGYAVPELSGAAALPVAALVLLVLYDAHESRGRLAGVSVEAPPMIRLAKGREERVQLNVSHTWKHARKLRLGLAFPQQIQTENVEQNVTIPSGGAHAVEWECLPLERGDFLLESCHVEAASPLGFWACRAALPLNLNLRVYPNLFTERKFVSALFLNRAGVGIHAQRQVGQGREFEKLRDYVHGDSPGDIHWRASAKRGHPVTKVYRVERTQEIYVIIDSSRLSARDAKPPNMGFHQQELVTALERFVTTGLVLGVAAEKQGDLFGLLSFDDKIRRFVRAKTGKNHYNTCRDAVYALQPRPVMPDFEELCAFIRLRLRKRSLLFFLTDLDDPVLSENFLRGIEMLNRHHLVVVAMMRPPHAHPLFSRTDVEQPDDIYRALGGHLRWRNLRELEIVLKRKGVRFQLLDNAEMSLQLVSQYIDIKQRQLL